MVSSILHALFLGRLSPTSQHLRHLGVSQRTNDSLSLQDVAAACIFLATKTEECGRKLRDIAKICQSKVSMVPTDNVSSKVCRLPFLQYLRLEFCV